MGKLVTCEGGRERAGKRRREGWEREEGTRPALWASLSHVRGRGQSGGQREGEEECNPHLGQVHPSSPRPSYSPQPSRSDPPYFPSHSGLRVLTLFTPLLSPPLGPPRAHPGCTSTLVQTTSLIPAPTLPSTLSGLLVLTLYLNIGANNSAENVPNIAAVLFSRSSRDQGWVPTATLSRYCF